MTSTLQQPATPITAQAPALPLAWFEFADHARPVQRYEPDAPGAAPATWAVQIDGRPVPFKFIRRAPTVSASLDVQRSTLNVQRSMIPPAPRPILVLLHGLGITVATYHGIAPYLFESHDLLLIDYNGFSVDGGWPVGGVSMRMMAATVWAAADALQIPTVSIAGASMGGGLAIMATLQRPQAVQRVALFNPAVYPQSLPFFYNVARTPLLGELAMAVLKPEKMINGAAWVGYSSPEKMPAELRRIYERNMEPFANRIRFMDDIRHLPGSDREMRHYADRIARLRQPMLVIWGCQERLLRCNAARRLAQDLPHVQYHEFAHLAHAPHEEDPALIGPVVAEFLSSPSCRTVPGKCPGAS
jgi:pimeloyl-ACP methyl ester carboxylesterase